MLSFISSRQRKLGVGALICALLFLAAWGRSFRVVDHFSTQSVHLVSNGGLLFIEFCPRLENWEALSHSVSDASNSHNAFHDERYQTLWSWKWMGFGYGHEEPSVTSSDGKTFVAQMYYFNAPIIWFAIPCTLLSAWLLLSRPRSKFDYSQLDLKRDETNPTPRS